jgi:GTPase SAR1 family protein
VVIHDSAELVFPGSDALGDTEASYVTRQLRANDALIVAYDSCSIESFDEARERWLPIARKIWRVRGGKCVLVLVGTKKDAAEAGMRLIDGDNAFEVAKQFSAGFIEVSARFCTNITTLFKYIVEEVEKRNPTKQSASNKKCAIA